MTLETPRRRFALRPDRLGAGLFWLWNLVFVSFMVLGFGPAVLPDLWRATLDGEAPWALFGLIGLLTLIPVAALALGLWRVRGQGRRLFALGFAVEGPLMALLVVRIFGFREANPAAALLLSLLAVGLAAFLWQLLDGQIEGRGRAAQGARWIGLCLLSLAGLYAAVWSAFYAFPLAVFFVDTTREVLSDIPGALLSYLRSFRGEPFLALLVLPTAALTSACFVALPVLSVLHWLAAWRRAGRGLAARVGRLPTAVAGGATVAAAIAGLVLAARQPQVEAFRALASPPADAAEARVLVEHSALIREGLLNAYLARQRYISARGEVGHIHDIYTDVKLNGRQLLSSLQADRVQAAYERVASPMLYQPAQPGGRRALHVDPPRAAELYEAFFDEPIHRAERETIVRTVASNWNIAQASVDRLAIDDREVHVQRRELAILDAGGGWAELELHEAYLNRTDQPQEVVYHFNLPEGAAVSGLWLGESGDRTARIPFRVSPRGAAQQVYREETQVRMKDPALLEQLGPRQYRLRAFPVPARRWTGESGRRAMEDGPPLHLWLTFVVPAVPARPALRDGLVHAAEGPGPMVWPLPSLAERRNAYWDRRTEWALPAGMAEPEGDGWLPAELPADPEAARTPGETTVDVGAWRVVMRPAPAGGEPAGRPMPERLAVVVDRSRSMTAVGLELDAALAELGAAMPAAEVDVILSASEHRGEPASRLSLAALAPEQLSPFGGQDPAELVRQYQAQAGGRRHDAVLVLTDASAYGRPGAAPPPATPWTSGPLWLVHLADRLPMAYDDPTLDTLVTSGGGVAGSVGEALRRWAIRQGVAPGGELLDEVDGWAFRVSPRPRGAASPSPSPLLRKAAARQALLAQAREAAGTALDAADLDRLHALAKDEGIVSPFSSMIVVVEERQARRLDELEANADRFGREVEPPPADPSTLAVTAVPEPETWMLMGLAAMLLAWRAHRMGYLIPARS